ncbi:MAG: AI-2E family transporter [Lentisphaeria bacterium]
MPTPGAYHFIHKLLSVSTIDRYKMRIENRKRITALFSTALVVILVAAPIVFLIQTAVYEGKHTLDYSIQKLQSKDFRTTITRFYQQEKTHRFLEKVENSTIGKTILINLEKYLDSPDLLNSLDLYMNSLVPQDTDKTLVIPIAQTKENTDSPNPQKTNNENLQESLHAPDTKTKSSSPTQAVNSEPTEEDTINYTKLLKKAELFFFNLSKGVLNLSHYFIMKSISGIGSFLFNIFVIIIIIFFMFYQGSFLYHFFRKVGPFSNKDYNAITERLRDVSRTVFLGIVGTACIQGLVAMIGYSIVGLPAFFLGILSAFCAIIPFVGTALVWGPATIYFLIIGKTNLAIFMFAWGLLVANIDGFFRPLLMCGGKTKLSYGVLFFAILIGLKTFGLLGILYGPLLAGLIITSLDIFAKKYKNPPL